MKNFKYLGLAAPLLLLAACGQMGAPEAKVTPDSDLAALDFVTAGDVVTPGNTSKVPGDSGSARFYLTNENNNNGDPVNACNASTSAPVTVTVTSSDTSKVTINGAGTVTLTDCGTLQAKVIGYQVLSTATEGSVTITGQPTGGKAGGTLKPGSFTIQITIPAPIDTTAPEITPAVTPSTSDGLNGWYKSSVTVRWNVLDDESTISSSSGCASTTIETDTSGTTLTCTATSAGGTNSKSVTIKRDATAPVLEPGDVNNTTWRNSSLSQEFAASDATSGLANDQDESFTLTASAQSTNADTPTTVSKTVTDKAGNSTTRTLSALIDLTKPTVGVTGVSNGETYTLGSVPAAGCSTTDALSGVKTDATLSTSAGSVGSITATCSGAEDVAGNTNSASVTYNVIYNFTGFFSPVDMNGVYNVAKAGSAIPVKFKLGGDYGLGVISKIASVKVACPSTMQTDTLEETTSGTTSGLKYDATADQYNYTWKTATSLAGTCQRLEMQLNDSSSVKTAFFKFTK